MLAGLCANLQWLEYHSEERTRINCVWVFPRPDSVFPQSFSDGNLESAGDIECGFQLHLVVETCLCAEMGHMDLLSMLIALQCR